MRFLYITLALLCGTSSFAQSAQDYVQKIMDNMLGLPAYTVNTEYALYKNEETDKTYEQYKGSLSKLEDKTYQKIGAMEFLKASNFFVKLNHVDKEIMIGASSAEDVPDFTNMDVSLLFEYFDPGAITKQGNSTVIELIGKPRNAMKIAKILVHVDRNTQLLQKQVFYMATLVDFSVYSTDLETRELAAARLEVTYSDFKKEIDPNLFDKARYFSVEGNDTIILAQEFKDFEFFPAY